MARRLAANAAALGLALVLGPTGCGSPTPEEQLAALSQERENAESAVEEAQGAVIAQEAVVEQAQTTLEVRREELDEARRELAEVNERLQAVASDPVIFRGVQRRLLEDPLFEGLAIRVEVERGVVSLHGGVPDDATREAAVEAARRFPGVTGVRSRLEVPAPGEKPARIGPRETSP